MRELGSRSSLDPCAHRVASGATARQLRADGCSTSSDKAGGTAARKTIVLRLAIGTDSTEVGGFGSEVSRLSGDTVRVVAVPGWRLGQVSFEHGVIADVKSGKVDLGAVASRAWDEDGVTSFRALGAPLLIDSYALQQRVLSSTMVGEMLAGLRTTGLVGLGVLPGCAAQTARGDPSAPRPFRLQGTQDRAAAVAHRERDPACVGRDAGPDQRR